MQDIVPFSRPHWSISEDIDPGGPPPPHGGISSKLCGPPQKTEICNQNRGWLSQLRAKFNTDPSAWPPLCLSAIQVQGGRSEILACSFLLCSLLWHLGFLSSSFIAAGVWMNELNHFQVLKLLYIKQISPPKTHNDVHIYLSFKKRIRQTCGKGSWLNVSHGERRPPGNCFQRSNN